MTPDQFHASLIFSSPAGTTARTATAMAAALADLGTPHTLRDLGKKPADLGGIRARLADPDQPTMLFVGSPVYSSHAVPPITEFLDGLPPLANCFAVPFVTWGGATSGLALPEMAAALIDKGAVLAGAARIMAVHSLMWRLADPVGVGRPNNDDLRLAAGLAADVVRRAAAGSLVPLPIERLHYQPADQVEGMRQLSIAKAKQILPARRVNADRCTACGICRDECPAAAIELDPLPRFLDHCFLCFSCVRQCPEEAIEVDLVPIYDRIRDRAVAYGETPPTMIFSA
ncbi:MAG: 4Fe-4S binding protein [Deltaproteobacteria bacterium]|nr:4Fe-4S binding protein [Candidatus Anaeroferrophillacea bacterium]